MSVGGEVPNVPTCRTHSGIEPCEETMPAMVVPSSNIDG